MTLEIQETPQAIIERLSNDLMNEREVNLLIQESLGDLEVAAEDTGWRMLSMELNREFSRDGMSGVTRNCTIMAIASPLIKRALQLRTGYIWGQGVNVSAKDDNVNKVVQAFWDDDSNKKALTSPEAQEENEHVLGTDGNLFFTFFTNPVTGRVQIRTTPFFEVQDKICSPGDRDETWFFYREYSNTVIEPGFSGFRRRAETRRVFHPAVGYWPQQRPTLIDNIPVLWDQPMMQVAVNRPTKTSKWGIPDVYAGLPWARAYEGFLTDWAKLVKALSRFAWKVSGDSKAKSKAAAAAIRSGQTAALPDAPVGAAAAMGPGQNLEAIPKTGATVDAGSGRPLAGLVAASMGVSVVDLLADPGVTGARAVAETLDKPIVLEMQGRQRLWQSVIQEILSYVVDASAASPRGPLSGTVTRDRDSDRRVVTLAGDVNRTVEVDFPSLDEPDPARMVEAFEKAEGFGTPPAVLVKLTLQLLKVKNVDEIMTKITDENGDLKDTGTLAAAAAIQQHRNGGDPAAAL